MVPRQLLPIALALAACTSTVPDEPVSPPPLRLAFGPFTGASLNMTVGASTQIYVRVLTTTGAAVTPSIGPSFISRNPATVAADQSGLVTALAAGSTYLVAEAQVGMQQLRDSVLVVTLCTLELRIELTPPQQTLAVGGRFVPSVSLSSCGGHVTLTDAFTWSATDPTILSVDPSSGETTALKVGTTSVWVRGTHYGILAYIPVTVQ